MRTGRVLLDASAILALLFDEEGATTVQAALPGASVATVNWSEVCQRLLDRHADVRTAREHLAAAGLTFEPLSTVDAERAAALRRTARQAGLALGDRCCLALAARLGRPALTADSAWKAADVDVRMIR